MTQHALIIDDNPSNLAVLAELLQLQGISCTTLTYADKLESILATLPPLAVIFLDLEMPAISGYTIRERLRRDRRFDGVPIVAYTVHVSERGVAQQRGFDSFLGKPLDFDRFPEYLNRILKGESVWALGA